MCFFAVGTLTAWTGGAAKRVQCARLFIPVSVKKTLLRIRRPLGALAVKIQQQGVESSFCCWIAWQRLS